MLKLNTLYKAQRVALYTLFGCLNVNAAYADFLEDSEKSIYLRNFYVERDLKVPIKTWAAGHKVCQDVSYQVIPTHRYKSVWI
ncbi:hypothetical protein ACFSHO_14315 [Acinetobacter vivianii]